VDLQDASPLEVANQVAAKVKQHARPWRAIIAFVLAVGAASVSVVQHVGLRSVFESGRHAPPVASRIVWLSTTVAFVVFAVIAVVEIGAKTRQVLSPRTGTAHAAVVRFAILLIGAVIIFISILALLKIPVTQLLVGGAVTTIFIGIAAQQSLGNVFAGIVLLFSRPFQVGDVILLRSGALGGLLTGTVTEIGLTYVRLDTGDGVMHLPNSQVLAAGVGQIRPPAPELPPSPETPSANVPGATPGSGGAPGAAPPNGRPSGVAGPGTAPSGTAAPAPGTAPPGAGAPSGEAPGSGGRPLSPPGL
jgi:hypothetical protein